MTGSHSDPNNSQEELARVNRERLEKLFADRQLEYGPIQSVVKDVTALQAKVDDGVRVGLITPTDAANPAKLIPFLSNEQLCSPLASSTLTWTAATYTNGREFSRLTKMAPSGLSMLKLHNIELRQQLRPPAQAKFILLLITGDNGPLFISQFEKRHRYWVREVGPTKAAILYWSHTFRSIYPIIREWSARCLGCGLKQLILKPLRALVNRLESYFDDNDKKGHS